ncbi:MAG: hypothetical protein J5I98_04620 [Phaeodactylibacter sp.]|nr:hypothetical protein [Phaeodactylibacter sp.]
MKKITLLGTLWIILFSCGGQGGQTGSAAGELPYRTTAPSLLYFKNIRSAYYEMSEQPGTRIELYRLRKFSGPSAAPLLVPVIANNWLKDEAYLFLEPAEYDGAYATPITVRWEAPADTSIYRLQPATVARQRELALHLYEGLRAGRQASILAADSTWAPLFGGNDIRDSYSTAIRDYLRLTEALR